MCDHRSKISLVKCSSAFVVLWHSYWVILWHNAQLSNQSQYRCACFCKTRSLKFSLLQIQASFHDKLSCVAPVNISQVNISSLMWLWWNKTYCSFHNLREFCSSTVRFRNAILPKVRSADMFEFDYWVIYKPTNSNSTLFIEW